MVDYKRIIDSAILSDTAGVIYTNTDGTHSYIKLVFFHNYTGVDVIVTMWDGTNTDENEFVKTTVEAYATTLIELNGPGIVKEGTEVIWAVCDTASACNVRAFGGRE